MGIVPMLEQVDKLPDVVYDVDAVVWTSTLQHCQRELGAPGMIEWHGPIGPLVVKMILPLWGLEARR